MAFRARCFTVSDANGGVTTANAVRGSYVYAGWTTNPGPYSAGQIAGLTELFTSAQGARRFDITLSPTNGGAGAYLVVAYLDVLGPAPDVDFEIGSFANGDMTQIQSGLSITDGLGTASYSVARSDFLVEAPGGIRFARE